MTAQVQSDPEIAPVEAYTPAERAFERRRRTLGLFLAPALFIIVLALPNGLEPQAHKMAATMTLVVVLWMTEAIPLAVTALIGPGVAVALQMAPAAGLAPFADPIIFLVLGGFIIAQAMLVHGVDRRVVYRALSIPGVGSSALRVLIVYGALCAAHLDVGEQHRDDRDDVSDRAVGGRAQAQSRAGEPRRGGLSLRDGDDAADGVRGLDRRDGDAHRHGHRT